MSKLITFKGNAAAPVRPVGVLEVDVDPAASRVTVFNRNTMLNLIHLLKPTNNLLRIILPVEHATGNDLIVGILDDRGEYGAKVIDGVAMQIVDANVVVVSN